MSICLHKRLRWSYFFTQTGRIRVCLAVQNMKDHQFWCKFSQNPLRNKWATHLLVDLMGVIDAIIFEDFWHHKTLIFNFLKLFSWQTSWKTHWRQWERKTLTVFLAPAHESKLTLLALHKHSSHTAHGQGLWLDLDHLSAFSCCIHWRLLFLLAFSVIDSERKSKI